ncbi:MAG: hypothetical protein Kow0010_11370 [Dehalococcoidia bacterium]
MPRRKYPKVPRRETPGAPVAAGLRQAHGPPRAARGPGGHHDGALALLGLQRAVGNRAVNRAVGGSTAVIDRLWTKSEFRKSTKAGFFKGRGKTLQQIEKLLDEYHALRAKGLHAQPGPHQDRAINILHEIREDIALWKKTHEGDKSSSKLRTGGMNRLWLDAGAELKELTKMRNAAREFLGEKKEPVTRTENKFVTQMEGSATSILSKLGPVLGVAAPSAGDTAEVEVAIKIPVDPSGVGYLGGRIKAAVERQKTGFKVRFELAITGGAKVANLVDIGGELGMYIEAQGATPEKAMELVSYGMYRRIRESRVIPNEMANFIWGGSTTTVGWKRAEKWAAKVEKENIKGGSDTGEGSVETGALAGVKAGGGVGGVAKLGGSAQYSTGKKYTKESIEKRKAAGLGKESKVPWRRGLVEVIGESTHQLALQFSASGGPFSGGIGVTLQWASHGPGTRATLTSLGVSFSATTTIPMNQLVVQGIGGYLVPLSAMINQALRKAAANAANEKTSKGQDIGEIIHAAENGGTAIMQIAQVPKDAWVPKFELSSSAPPTVEAPVDVKLSIAGGYDFDAKKFKFSVKLEYIKGLTVNVGVFKGTVKQGKLLLLVQYDGTNWNVA